MKNYITVDEISAEIGVNRTTICKKAKLLGIDTSKITETRKRRLIKACEETILRKEESKAFMKYIQNAKVGKSSSILATSGSTLEQRLIKAKEEYDNVCKSLDECQKAIEIKGVIVLSPTNSTISSNPAVKTKCELLKQFNALQKTIQELEEKMKLPSVSSESPIDD